MNNPIREDSKIKEAPLKKNQDILNSLKNILITQSIWIILVLCIIFFSVASPYFLTFLNLTNVLANSSIVGFMAIGMTFVMINGNIDLSVGSIMALVSAVVITLQPYGILTSVIAGVLVGILMGALNGFIVAKLHVNAFITTLAAMMGVRGLVYVVTKEQSISGTNMKFTEIGSLAIGPIPIVVVAFILFFLAGEWVLRRTSHGVNTFAIGGNNEAAKNTGINVEKNIILNFIIIGAMCALSGITIASQTNAATPTMGDTYEIWVIAAVVLGGTSLKGGIGSVVKTLGGVLVIGVIRNGMNMLGVDSYYVYVVMGLILIVVMFLDSKIQKNSN